MINGKNGGRGKYKQKEKKRSFFSKVKSIFYNFCFVLVKYIKKEESSFNLKKWFIKCTIKKKLEEVQYQYILSKNEFILSCIPKINPNHYFVYMYLPFITSAEMHTVNEYSNLILRTSDADGTRWYQKGQVSHSVSIK